MNPSDIKLLAVCDSPTLTTGFARVAGNLLRRFPLKPEQIHVWGIGFDGNGYDTVPWKVFPSGSPWHSPRHLSSLLQAIYSGRYTHVWMLQDLFQLSQAKFPQMLHAACQAGFTAEGERPRTRTCLYFPVDAHWMPPDWLDILTVVDAAVAYTEFGKEAVLAADRVRTGTKDGGSKGEDGSPPSNPRPLPLIRVIPHGVDPAIYRPLETDREELRRSMWKLGGESWVKPGDFVMLNVNTNQRRKDVGRSLEILAGLKARGVPAKLVMHMAEADDTTISLERIGAQLGLELGMDWLHHGQFFERSACRSTMPESELAKLYHAADLVLTTTHGEGWGLSITEALACGCPVALPLHTSCAEIYSRLMDLRAVYGQLVPLLADQTAPVLPYDNGLIRPRVNLERAVDTLEEYARRDFGEVGRPKLNAAALEWLNWDRIAAAMWSAIVGNATEERS